MKNETIRKIVISIIALTCLLGGVLAFLYLAPRETFALLLATETPTPSATPPPSSTATPSATPTPSPTATTLPSPTATPTPAPPSPSPTPTFPPPPEEANVPILMYHYVEELPAGADRYRRDLTVDPADFEAQLQYLADAGYETITLAHLHHHLTEGQPLPDRPIILTFDDGYRDAYTTAFPLLQEYGFVGTFFVLATPAHFENPQYLTWGMMAEMAAAGMDIQGHGRDHVDMRNRTYDYLVYQLLGVKEAVENHTDQPVVFFCYPSGQYDAAAINVLQAAGYWGAVTTEHGRVHSLDNLFTLPRLRIRGTDSLEAFIARVEGE